MAHEIDTSNNRENMAYVGDDTWHGLGQKLTENATVDDWKREAGMEWKASETPVIYEITNKETNKPQRVSFNGRKVIYRSDTQVPLSVVSDEYKVVHPGEILEFFRDISEAGGFKMETAGCLFGGKKFWALAKTGEEFKLMGVDGIKPYLLLATSVDGSMATCAHFTSVRVVCNNTLRMAIGAGGQKATLRIPHQSQFNAELVKAELGVATVAWESFLEKIETLARMKIERDVAIDVVAAQLKGEWKKEDQSLMTQEEMLESSLVLRRIMSLYDGGAQGANLSTVQGTAWGLVNAVTEYFDHKAGANSKDFSRAFERAQLTDRAKFKTDIANNLLSMA